MLPLWPSCNREIPQNYSGTFAVKASHKAKKTGTKTQALWIGFMLNMSAAEQIFLWGMVDWMTFAKQVRMRKAHQESRCIFFFLFMLRSCLICLIFFFHVSNKSTNSKFCFSESMRWSTNQSIHSKYLTLLLYLLYLTWTRL